MFNLKDKIAIITGASQGIGETIAIVMADSGAYVICLARNKDALDSTIDIIKKNNSDIVEDLKQLNDLYKSGALTKEEFEKAKKKIIN